MAFKEDLTVLSLAAMFNGCQAKGLCLGIAYALLYDIIAREERSPNSGAWKEPGSFMDVFMLINSARENTSTIEMAEYIRSAMQIAKGRSDSRKHRNKIVKFLKQHAKYDNLAPTKRSGQFYQDVMAYIDQVTFFHTKQIDLVDDAGLKQNYWGFQDPRQKSLILGRDITPYQIRHVLTDKNSVWDAIHRSIKQISHEKNTTHGVSVFILRTQTHVSVIVYQKGDDAFMLINHDQYWVYEMDDPLCHVHFKTSINLHPRDSFIITQYQTACPRDENKPVEITVQIPKDNKEDFLYDVVYTAMQDREPEITLALPKITMRDKDHDPMCMAIMTNDSALIAAAIQKGYSDHQSHKYQETFLVDSCIAGRINYVKTLVEYGVNINCCYKDMTPLHAAFVNNHKDISSYLLKKGASLIPSKINNENLNKRVTIVTKQHKSEPLQEKSLFKFKCFKGMFHRAKSDKKSSPSNKHG
ncbi:MAG: ankyrin repeat domain-containing protein [Pseudomonadota bacterium]|nr:ankyrin repeat domain-containing protein [Pseudomonadota bacterium]